MVVTNGPKNWSSMVLKKTSMVFKKIFKIFRRIVSRIGKFLFRFSFPMLLLLLPKAAYANNHGKFPIERESRIFERGYRKEETIQDRLIKQAIRNSLREDINKLEKDIDALQEKIEKELDDCKSKQEKLLKLYDDLIDLQDR